MTDDLKMLRETLWLNPELCRVEPRSKMGDYGFVHVRAAQARLMRFMPYIASAFPETASKKGLIESELIGIDPGIFGKNTKPNAGLFIKDDAHLPIAGSVKARGGIHEVLSHAEKLAMREEILKPGMDYACIDSESFRHFFSKYTLQVGSTGNLGLSVGIMGAKLGFRTIVHMSSDARTWKKELLMQKGAEVREYNGDYCEAVKSGREASDSDPMSYFVDDENSEDLFFGYSTAALRLKVQLYKKDVAVDAKHPLFVYIPCGVGGAPGGITYGLKQMFGDSVHCFFAEPVLAPCFTYAMSEGGGNISELGINGKTCADGLAVQRASGLVCRQMKNLVSGSYTVSESAFLRYAKLIYEKEGLFLEPSACAGAFGAEGMLTSDMFDEYIDRQKLGSVMEDATHIIWATGGGMVPEKIMREYL